MLGVAASLPGAELVRLAASWYRKKGGATSRGTGRLCMDRTGLRGLCSIHLSYLVGSYV